MEPFHNPRIFLSRWPGRAGWILGQRIKLRSLCHSCIAQCGGGRGGFNTHTVALAAGTRRFLHISSISAYGHVNGEGLVLDETAPIGQHLYKWAYYSRSKVAAERIVWDAHDSGRIEVMVIRPAWIYGPRDRTTVARLVAMIRQGQAKILGRGDNRLNVVYAGNIAEAAVTAAGMPEAAGEAFNCSNDGEITQQAYFDLWAQACNAPAVKRHVPYRLAYVVGFVLECLGHLFRWKDPPFVTRYAVWLMGRRSYFSADKARKLLDWQPTVTYEVGVPMTVKWLHS